MRFFETAIALVKAGNVQKARKMFVFPEPENLIGLSKSGYAGRGMGNDLGEKVFAELIQNSDIQQHGLRFINELHFMIEGVSNDLISDMSVNIAKRYFVEYTNRQCELWKIPVHRTTTHCFIPAEGVWDEVSVTLPVHPETGESFLLTPAITVRRFVSMGFERIYKDFLRHILKGKMEPGEGWNGIGKQPKIKWKDVEEQYPCTKGFVVEMFHKDPTLRREFTGTLKREARNRALEFVIEKLGLTPDAAIIPLSVLENLQKTKLHDENLAVALKKFIEQRRTEIAAGNSGNLFKVTDSLNAIMERCAKELVLLLGSYAPGQETYFNEVREILEGADDDYRTCIINEMPDVGAKNPRQKVIPYASFSRFIVVLDFNPSGHLNEIELLKDFGVPIAIISKDKRGSSYMVTGLDHACTFIKRFTFDDHGNIAGALRAAVDWAETKRRESIEHNTSHLPWLDN